MNILEVHIWDDKASNIVEIETITDEIDKELNKLQINNSKMQICIFRDTPYRLKLEDPDIHIQRRELRYIAKVYYK